jgi:hypothetical protein
MHRFVKNTSQAVISNEKKVLFCCLLRESVFVSTNSKLALLRGDIFWGYLKNQEFTMI